MVFETCTAHPFIDSGDWALLKEITDKKLLVSLHHYFDKSANMAIFDISKKNRPKKIYTFEEVYGGNIISNLSFSLIKAFFIFLPLILISHLVTGNGDVTYNQREESLAQSLFEMI